MCGLSTAFEELTQIQETQLRVMKPKLRQAISTGAIAACLLVVNLWPHAVLGAGELNEELPGDKPTDEPASERAPCSLLGSLPQGFYSVRADVGQGDASSPHSVLAVYAASRSDPSTCLKQREVNLPSDAELWLKDSARGALIFKASGAPYADLSLTELLEVQLPAATVTIVAQSLIFDLPCAQGRRMAAIRRLGPHTEDFSAALFQLEVYDFPMNAAPTGQVVAKGRFYSKYNSGEADEILSAGMPWDQGANLPQAWTKLFAWRGLVS